MAYKVAIDARYGGINSGTTSNGITEKDYNLEISKYINERLNKLGIESFLVRDSDTTLSDDERVNVIKNKYGTGNNIIVLSNRLGEISNTGAEIMYALRNNSRLASNIASNLESVGRDVNKYYQLRNPNNTALDNDYLIRNTPNNQTIAIYYGYPKNINEANFLKNNINVLGEAVVKAIANYAGVNYIPDNLEGYYIVKKGDSLYSIANKNNTTVNELKELNNLSTNTLSIGQLIKLPIGTNNDNTVDNSNFYIVQKGDSLYSISRKFNTTVDNIKRLNNLTSNLLSIGQKLVIGNSNDTTNQITYVVKKGDSLWIIANKYDTTVDEIKRANNLSSNLLSIGQTLIIPSTSNYITYTVKKGDSLWIIANKYNTTVAKIKKLNNLSSNLLSIGQTLLIPA